jgi:hypothetical protein
MHIGAGDLVEILTRFIDSRIVARLGSGDVGRPTYSQRDGERPVGCGRTKFLGVHKRARGEGDAGASIQGRARLMTADCWARWCNALPSRASTSEPSRTLSVDDVIAAKLGIRRVA